MKNHGIEFEEMLLREMRSQYADANRVISAENGEKLSERADKFVIDMYGSKEGKQILLILRKLRKISSQPILMIWLIQLALRRRLMS